MSLCFDYDFQKWTVLSLGLIAATLIVGLIILIGEANGQSKSDFYLEGKTKTSDTITAANAGKDIKITKFEIQGNGSKQICPSLQCSIDYKNEYTFFTPATPKDLNIGFDVDFRLRDNITHADLGPIKKEAIEQYEAVNFACPVNDIIEDNGQEIYICQGNSLSVFNKFDKTSYPLNATMIYDAKNETLKISGNFTGTD